MLFPNWLNEINIQFKIQKKSVIIILSCINFVPLTFLDLSIDILLSCINYVPLSFLCSTEFLSEADDPNVSYQVEVQSGLALIK